MFPLRAVQRLIFLGLARLLPPLNFQELTQTKFSALISQGNEIFAPLREAHVTFMTGAVFKRFPSKSLSLTQCLVTNYFFSVIFMQSLDKYASTSSRKYIPSIWYQRQKAGLNGFRWKRLSSIWDRITPTTCLCSERSQLSLMKPTWGLWISKNLKYFSIIFRDVKILGNCKYLFHSKYFLFASCFYWTKVLS